MGLQNPLIYPFDTSLKTQEYIFLFNIVLLHHLPLPFPPFKSTHALLLHSWHLCSLIVIVCIYPHVYTYISLNTTCSIWIMLLVYVFLELTIWCWIISQWALPLGRLFLLLSIALHCDSSLCKAEASWTFLYPLWHVYDCSLLRSCLGSHAGETWWV